MKKFLDWLKTENIAKSQKLIENFYSSALRLEIIMLNINGKDVIKIKLKIYFRLLNLIYINFIKGSTGKRFYKTRFCPIKR